MALWSIDPAGEERADLRAGIIASVYANVNRDRDKKPQPFVPNDFMPFARSEDVVVQQHLSRKIRNAFMARRK